MLSSMNRDALGGGSPSYPTDLYLSQVNATMLAPYSIQNNSNSLTRKEGPESACTRNGCADSIPIVNRDNVECSAPVDKYVEHSRPSSNKIKSPNAATDYNVTTRPIAATDYNVTNRPNAATDYNVTNGSNANADSYNTNESSVNADSTVTVNSSANTELPNTSDTYMTWFHSGGLLRPTTSVGPSML